MPLSPGQTLNNRYRIVKLLGQGGFGAVYRAWDANLDEPVALKESFETSPSAQKQFQLEAKLLFRLVHPNLPRVHDTFVIPGQGMYLVMDYIEGEDLGAMLQNAGGPLPEAQVLPWIGQICEALEYLHSQNPPIIHRDIKPGNIKVTTQGKAMLVDFGIAKVYDPDLSTTAGARAVTPGYSPQEQYGVGITDARTDVYALGATLYHLLTGKQPPESIQRNLGASLMQPHQLNAAVSPQVEVAILKALEPLPENRWQSITEFKRTVTGVQAPISIQVPVTQAARFQTQPIPALAQPAIPNPKSQISNLRWIGALGVILAVALLIYLFSNGGDSGKPTTQTVAALATATHTTIPSQTPTHTPGATHTPTETLEPTLTPTQASPTPTELAKRITDTKGVEMVLVPAGEFQMGSNDGESNEKPVHTVNLNAFYIDVYEVTNKLYNACVRASACSVPRNSRSSTRDSYYSSSQYEHYPVVSVTWQQAVSFCEWRWTRLPTEAEWEKAARGGAEDKAYPWGGETPVCTKGTVNGAQFGDCLPQDTVEVGSFAPNGYGLYDMAGNVWEWVQDWYLGNYYGSLSVWNNPLGPANNGSNLKVLRGGSWGNVWLNLRSAKRGNTASGGGYLLYSNQIGFRCVVKAVLLRR